MEICSTAAGARPGGGACASFDWRRVLKRRKSVNPFLRLARLTRFLRLTQFIHLALRSSRSPLRTLRLKTVGGGLSGYLRGLYILLAKTPDATIILPITLKYGRQ